MDTLDDILEHHGVKGMKWGVHKDGTPYTRSEHKAWKKKAGGTENANKVFQEALRTSKKDLNALNNRSEYKGKDLNHKSNYALAQKYDREISTIFNDHMVQASMKHAMNEGGDRVMMFQFDRNLGMMRADEMKRVVVHSQTVDGVDYPDFPVTLDALGQVVSIDMPGDDPVQHLEDLGADFLEHYGVKGMKWGVRREHLTTAHVRSKVDQAKASVKKNIAERTSSDTTVRAKPGQMVRVVGGVKRMPHEDAINARVAEQIAKKSTLDALSNKELQHLVNRMNLEAQYRNLAVKETRKSAGEKAVNDLLAGPYADVAFNKLGPHAAVGKKVANGAFKAVTKNKGLAGGIVSDKKDKKK